MWASQKHVFLNQGWPIFLQNFTLCNSTFPLKMPDILILWRWFIKSQYFFQDSSITRKDGAFKELKLFCKELSQMMKRAGEKKFGREFPKKKNSFGSLFSKKGQIWRICRISLPKGSENEFENPTKSDKIGTLRSLVWNSKWTRTKKSWDFGKY